MKKLFFAFICLFLAIPCQAGIIYVDADANGANDGSSWTNACNYLQDALAIASSGDQIWVAEGIYKPDEDTAHPDGTGNRSATFRLINGVAIKGGYAGYGEPDPNIRDIDLYETVLSGDLNGNDGADFADNGENSYHVLTSSRNNATAVLDGFIVTGGNANGAADPTHVGGGIYCFRSDPTLINCTFSGNSARHLGGGIYSDYGDATLIDCTLIGNRAGNWGGGMHIRYGSGTTLTNCVFIRNSAGSFGGGLYNYSSSSTLINCLFVGNSAGDQGGAIRSWSSTPKLYNCTFNNNSASNGGAIGNSSSTSKLTNCILWDNSGSEIFLKKSSAVVNHSDIKGGWQGIGNIDADPCFVQPGYWDANDTPDDVNDDFWIEGDYYLLPDSLCIDTGDPNYIPEPNETDLDGNPRVIGDAIDMGAYETNYIQAAMKLTPQMLNCNSKGKYVKAHITLPEGFLPEDIDVNEPAVAEPMGIESEYIKVLGAGTGPVKLEICFDREAFCDQITETGEVEITVIGSLTTSRYFYATDTIKIKP